MAMLKTNPSESAKAIREKLIANYNIKIPYYTVWKGKEKALRNLYGDWENSFRLLYNFKADIEERNLVSIVEVDRVEENGKVIFNRFFMALKPCIDGFKFGCRPYFEYR